MSTRRWRFWWLGIVIACSVALVWLTTLHHQQPALPRAVAIEPSEPAAELADDPSAPAPAIEPRAHEPSPPRAERPQPSAAEAATAESPSPAPTEFENTPRKRAPEPLRLHFAHAPETRTPGLGLSKAACAELRERQQRAESLSDRELMHLRIDCRGR